MRPLFSLCLFAALASAHTLTPVWIELGPEGVVLARAVIEPSDRCPELRADGHSLSLQTRQPVPDGMKPACQAVIPPGTRSLRWDKQKLRLPKTPDRIITVGDTGCRVKGGQIQACDDPELWPFQAVSEQVAKLKPDLIVHVGDYLYREGPCPKMVQSCTGPNGDNWEAWNADFFSPAREALAAAPWIFARGNHESCSRSFRGWFYYLDPRPFDGVCSPYTEPYVAQSGQLRLGVLDTASTKDVPNTDPAQIPIYAKQLTALSGRADWLVDHHPFWGYTAKASGVSPTDLTLGPAWAQAQPQGIALVLSGHVHLFEFLALENGRPNQVIAGDSGTQLDTGITVDRSGSSVVGARVRAGEVNMSFGLTELQRKGDGWILTLRNARGVASLTCSLPGNAAPSCHANR
ncbi:MAG: metallophosphoesterase [Acidobacteriota bacterium]|nr:metallophosphoesterase [Acidobacteriota bacterium]